MQGCSCTFGHVGENNLQTKYILLLRSGEMCAVGLAACSHWTCVGVCDNVQIIFCKE